jgi:hypothetical protein
MGAFDVKLRRHADGSLASEEAPEPFEVIVQVRYDRSKPQRVECFSEPLNTFLRRNWLGLMPEFGMCDLTWPG